MPKDAAATNGCSHVAYMKRKRKKIPGRHRCWWVWVRPKVRPQRRPVKLSRRRATAEISMWLKQIICTKMRLIYRCVCQRQRHRCQRTCRNIATGSIITLNRICCEGGSMMNRWVCTVSDPVDLVPILTNFFDQVSGGMRNSAHSREYDSKAHNRWPGGSFCGVSVAGAYPCGRISMRRCSWYALWLWDRETLSLLIPFSISIFSLSKFYNNSRPLYRAGAHQGYRHLSGWIGHTKFRDHFRTAAGREASRYTKSDSSAISVSNNPTGSIRFGAAANGHTYQLSVNNF